MRVGLMKVLLPVLWMAGGMLYLGSTLIATGTVKPFGDDEAQPISGDVKRPIQGQFESAKSNTADYSQSASGAANRRHAISPEQPSSDSPLAPTPEAPPQETLTLGAESSGQEVSEPQPSAVVQIKADANIRNGPTHSAELIGTAKAGAEIKIKAREGSWVQFVDDSSGNTGWIHSSLLAPPTSAGFPDQAATQAADESAPGDGPKPKAVKQRPKNAFKAYVESDKPTRKRRVLSTELPSDENISSPDRPDIELPSDEAFLAPRKRGRVGILERRRVLRDGLLSRDFMPPEN